MRSFTALTLGLGLILAVVLLVSPGHAAPPAVGPMALTNPLVAPSPNTHTAPTTSTVSVTYSEAVSPSSVSTQTFAIHAMQTGQLTETYGVVGATASLTPSRLFHPGELVQTSATTRILSLVDGQGPVSPTVWQFRTVVPHGTAQFVDSGQSLESIAADVALGDLDGDGYLDAFIVNGNGSYRPESVWLNDGTGTFSRTQYLGNFDSRAVALGDLDGDGDLDAFVAHNQPNLVYVNDGTGTFTTGWVQSSDVAGSVDVALGDLDGDGDLDAMVMNGGGFDDAIWFNDGTGNFPVRSALAGTGYLGDTVALGDLDGDGDLDALVGNWSSKTGFGLYPWWNDGHGVLTQGTHLGSTYTLDVALGDLDGDSDLDVYLAVGNGGNEVWVNEGGGVFTDTGQALGTRTSRAVALGDLDGDGDLDAYVVNADNTNNQNCVWLNDGGVFTDSGQLLGATASNRVVLGDVDGDGDLDALEANEGAVPNTRVRLNVNQADLGITKSVTPAIAAPGDSVTFTLIYTNAGPQAATDVRIEDFVPTSVMTLSASSVGATITATGSVSYTWEVADLAPGAGGVITVTGVLSPDLPLDAVITNTATITTTVIDGNRGNNTGEVTARIRYCRATPNDGSTIYMSVDAQALRDAVAAVSPGGTVKVAGRCVGAVWEAGHDQVVYIHDKDLTVRGGYALGDWSVSDPDTYPTTLDALNVPNHRVVYVYKNAVTLENLTLTNGYFSFGVDTGGGGGIFSDLSTLTLSNTVVSNSHGRVGGGIFIYQGGVTLVDSQVVSNTTSGSNTGGGGVFVYQGGASLTISGHSLIAHNDTGSTGKGGGVWCYYGDAALSGGEIRDNYARFGGGVHVNLGSASFSQTGGAVAHNSTSVIGHGGGLWVGDGAANLYGGQVISNTTFGDGGGLHVSSQWARLTVSGTAILSNTAAGRGGGVYNSGGTVQLSAGRIVSNTADLSGGGVYVRDANAVFTQTGGTISTNHADGVDEDGNGGGVYVGSGSAALGGGRVLSNTARNKGGGVYVADGSAVLTQTAGSIVGNEAYGGGGVYVHQGSAALSGEVISNTARGYGGGVYCSSGSTALNGGQIISNTAAGRGGGVYVAEDGGLFTQDSSGTISRNAAEYGGGLYANDGDTALNGHVVDNVASRSGGGVYIDNGTLTLAGSTLIARNVSDGTGSDQGGGGAFVGSAGLALNGAQVVSNTANRGGGLYGAVGAVTLDAGQIVSNTADLSGGGVYVSDANAVFTQTGGTIAYNEANGSGPDDGGGGLYVAQGTATLAGGEVTGNEAANRGGGVFVDSGTLTQAGPATVNHNTASLGGGVQVSGGTVAMSGGQICDNSASNVGGGMHVAAGSVAVGGGQVCRNDGWSGGGIYLHHGSVTLSAGEVISNTAVGSGGGVFVNTSSASFTQSGAGAIKGNTANGAASDAGGGGLFLNWGDAALNGGLITDNDAVRGGGVFVKAGDADLVLNGAEISDNRGNLYGGGVFVYQGDAVLGAGQVLSNSAGALGGGVYADSGGVTLSGADVVSNTADLNGGGLYVLNGDVTMSGGHVARNTADGADPDGNGGGLYLDSGSLTLNGGRIISNTALRSGGGIYSTDDVALNGGQVLSNSSGLDGGGLFFAGTSLSQGATNVIAHNDAENSGGGIFVGSASATLSGEVVSNTAGTNGAGVYVQTADVSLEGLIGNNVADQQGGGVYVDEGTIMLSGGEIVGNRADNGNGGGILIGHVSPSTTALTVTGPVSITGNYAQGYGGGVYAGPAQVTFEQGLIENNDADGYGGGMFVDHGTAVLSGTRVISNSAARGAGLGLLDGTAVLTSARILSNTATGEGGGLIVRSGSATLSDVEIVGNTGNSGGGGVFVETGQAVFVQTGGTIAGNDASNSGGGAVFVQDGLTTLEGVDIISNTGFSVGGLAVVSGTTEVLSSTIEGNGTGIFVGGIAGGSLLVENSVISDNLVAGLAYATQAPSAFSVTLGGAPAAANTFRDNGPGGTMNITVTASSDRPPLSALYNDWGAAGLEAIEDTLHHQFDSPALARVDYYTLALAADPLLQWADGVSPIVLTATVGGLLGPIPGDVISFTTTLGDLSAPAEATDAGQQASVDLTSLVSGTAYVTATAEVDPFNAYPLTVSVEFAYAAPTANGDIYEMPEDTTLMVPPPGVLDNDTDPGVGALAVTVGVEPVTGTLDLRADGAFTYTPPLDYSGVVTFTYVADNGRLTDTATVAITVTSVNDLPTISDIPDQVTTAGTPVGPILFTVGDLETDPSALLLDIDWDDLVLVAPGNAVFGGSGITRTLTITPTSGVTGVTTFTVFLDDGEDIVSDTFMLTATEHWVHLPLVLRDY
jgi:uncharacterized repeat protein (TIGR01451 family)